MPVAPGTPLQASSSAAFTRPRRVVHVVTGFQVGGAETALYRLVTQPQAGGYRHTVVALTPEGGMYQRFKDAGVELVVLDFRRSPVAGFLRLLRLMRSLQPDIVQTWLYHADLFGGLAARMAGIPSVIWGIHTTHISGGPLATAIVRRCCAWLSHRIPHTIICVAEAARREHVRLGYDPSRIVVVPNGFDLSFLAASPEQRMQLRQHCGIADEHIVIGTVGRFNVDKDHRSFVRAAARLAAQDERLRFLMVGKGLESGNAELASWIAATGYPERYILLGERSDIPSCLAAMDIFCLSSRTEAFPLAVGEAMAMGLPCVSTDVGDIAQLLGETGVIVPKADPEALADAVAGLLRLAPDGRQRLGQQAQARIRREFSIERVRARVEGIYDAVTRSA